MTDFKFVEPTCSRCEGHKDRGYSSRYCEGGKKPRRFRPSDPKIKAPLWCPKRNSPPIVRVYGFKDDNSMYLDYRFNENADPVLMSPHHYKVVYETTGFINAKDFYERANSESLNDEIGFEIKKRNVVEIDDGLYPYYFYCKGFLQFAKVVFYLPVNAKNTSKKNGTKRKAKTGEDDQDG